MKRVAILLLVCAALVVTGCAGKVKRVETDEVIDLSGRWNDTDSRLVSEEMIKDCLSRPWIDKFQETHGEKLPVVIVGTVRNRSSEHINVQTFANFVAAKDERDELREERKEQAKYSSEETAKAFGEEIGADFMLKGTINSILDKIQGKAVIFYQVNLELMNLETNRKVWIGDKKIKKFVKRKKLGL
jgi:uncharacterized protein (TIGR02722 family)